MGTRAGRTLRLSRAGLLLSLVMLCWCGCMAEEFPRKPVPEVDVGTLLEPVKIKIHHISSVERKESGGKFDGFVVACGIKDFLGDPVKALGVMRFEVYAYARSEPGNKGSRVGFWPNVNIGSVEAIDQHWNSVFGHYRFKLKWQRKVEVKERFVLEATLTTPEGKQLSDRRVLEARP